MARIRTIKPEFWTSEQVVECSPIARLLFIGIWNFADDHGRMVASPKQIKMRVFPGDDDITSTNVRRMLDELSANGLIGLYVVDNVEYLHVTGWEKHQKIDRPQPSRTPPPPSHSSNDRRTFVEHSLLEGKGREGSGRESSRKEESHRDRQTDSASPPRVGAREEPAMANAIPSASPSGFSRAASDALEARLREAAGYENSPHPGICQTGPIQALIDEGFDLDKEILPTIRARAKAMTIPARSWVLFVDSIRAYRESQRRSAFGAKNHESDFAARSLKALYGPTADEHRELRLRLYRIRKWDIETELGRRHVLANFIGPDGLIDNPNGLADICLPAEWIRHHLSDDAVFERLFACHQRFDSLEDLCKMFAPHRSATLNDSGALFRRLKAEGIDARQFAKTYFNVDPALPPIMPTEAA